MARIDPVPRERAGWLQRMSDWMARRRTGVSLEPINMLGHQPNLLFGYGMFELALERGKSVDAKLKQLAQLKAATLIGCPF